MANTCIHCGQCVRVCVAPSRPITLGENGPELNLKGCNRCGHCVAVCPADAIDHPLSPRQPMAGDALPPAEAERFLRRARSIRFYKDEAVPREKLEDLLRIGTYAMTGSNRQGVDYIVAEGRDRVRAAVECFCGEAERVCPDNPDVDWLMPRVRHYRETGEDAILRGAPYLILALSDAERNVKNAYFSCTFISLYAPSVGLGVCWAGMYETLACDPRFDAPFRRHFGVPENKAIKAVLMCGVPDVAFRRLTARDELRVAYLP